MNAEELRSVVAGLHPATASVQAEGDLDFRGTLGLYQRMIRRLLDAYVEAQEERPITGRSSRTARKRAAV